MGRRWKYSCAFCSEGVQTLDEADDAMLDLTVRRARIRNRESVLDLG